MFVLPIEVSKEAPGQLQLLCLPQGLTNRRQEDLFFRFQELGLGDEQGDDFADELPLRTRNDDGAPKLFMQAPLQGFQPGQ